MNEFVEQFLLESRELVDQATNDLLVLEKSPAEKEHLDSSFRAFHTLKGGAGIVDFAAMQTAVHAAEDTLAAARSGSRPLTKNLVGDCLACLDQVARWLDTIERTGDLPAETDAQVDAVVQRFARAADDAAVPSPPRPQSGTPHWLDAVLMAHADIRDRARVAFRYAPDADCFFRGDDPIARVAAVPGLLSLDMAASTPWLSLDVLDPFTCNLVFTILAEGTSSEVTAAMGDAAHQCEIHSLAVTESVVDERSHAMARQLLEAQSFMLAEKTAYGIPGRIGAAAIIAGNVLRRLRHMADAERIAQATTRSLAENDPRALREAIDATLNGMAPAIAVQTPQSVNQEISARTLRVDAARIDALVRLTGEITVAKNAIGHAARLAQDEDNSLAVILRDRFAVLDRLVGELQRSVLGIRVLPLRHVFQRLPRLMREISTALGKPATLVIEGDTTEADKAIVEMLFEPLLHILRNAMDHGVEDAATRAARGKPPVATIHLRASRQGDHVLVEMDDDGRGVDVARVREVAKTRGVVTDELLASMSEADVIDLIFAPGFSTAAEVTGLSGRGVGMDAVRNAVGRLGGQATVESRPGHGTTVRFTLPFSVMMSRVMTVEAGGQMFGIPLDAVVETVRVDKDRIMPIGAAHAIVLRDRTIPLVALAGALGVAPDKREETEATVVVTRIGAQYGALRVDRLGERMEVMLKPLEGLLSGMPGIAGTTLLGDGRILLILDLEELLQ